METFFLRFHGNISLYFHRNVSLRFHRNISLRFHRNVSLRFHGNLSFTESALLSVVISFAAKYPSYAGSFALHRCRLESNLKSSGCLFHVKLLMTVSL